MYLLDAYLHMQQCIDLGAKCIDISVVVKVLTSVVLHDPAGRESHLRVGSMSNFVC